MKKNEGLSEAKEKLIAKAREYLAEHSKYSEVFGETFVAVDTLTAMVDFAEQETKELKAQIEKMKSCENCINNYFLSTEEPCYSCTRCYARTTKKTTDNWELSE